MSCFYQNMFLLLHISRDRIAHKPVGTYVQKNVHINKSLESYSAVKMYFPLNQNTVSSPATRGERKMWFGLQIRGQSCCWGFCESLFIWISHRKTWKMRSLTKCDISGLMLPIWCVKRCRMCHLQCTSSVLNRFYWHCQPGQVQPDKVTNTLTSLHVSVQYFIKWECFQHRASVSLNKIKHTTAVQSHFTENGLCQGLLRWILLQCTCIVQRQCAANKHTNAAAECKASAQRLPLLQCEVSWGHSDDFMNTNYFRWSIHDKRLQSD